MAETDNKVASEATPKAETPIEAPAKSQLDTRIDELRNFIEEAKTELRSLVKEQEQANATAAWSGKVDGMTEAEITALQEALNARAANAQKIGVTGIESKESVNNV